MFSAVAFLRALVNSSDNEKRTELASVIGKARVAPMKLLTVPKLELQAALLASCLREEICEAFTIQIQRTFMWTDSITVLQWLNSIEKQTIFVAKRVSEILEGTTVDQWHHVATQNNPADAGKRGLSSEALQNSAWLGGPDFLRTSDFPFCPDTKVVSNINLKRHAADPNPLDNCSAPQSNCLNSDLGIHLRKYFSYPKFLRIVAYIVCIFPRHATYRSVDGNIVEPEEITAAEQNCSDNGTNFVGTEKKLLLCFQNMDKKKIASELAQKGVKWKFNPSAAPHQGGVWERLVWSFKQHFTQSLVIVGLQTKYSSLLFLLRNSH